MTVKKKRLKMTAVQDIQNIIEKKTNVPMFQMIKLKLDGPKVLNLTV